MIGGQLVELLRTCSWKELEEFKLFVASPYHNRGLFFVETQRFLDFLVRFHPDYPENRLTKKTAYEAVFADATYVDGKMEKLMSKLHILLKSFHEINYFQSEEYANKRAILLASIYRDRRLGQRFQGAVQKLEQVLEDPRNVSLATFEERFLLSYQIQAFEQAPDKKKEEIPVLTTIDLLDQFYLAYRLDLLSFYLQRQKISNLKFPAALFAPLDFDRLPEKYTEASPYLLIAHKILQLLLAESPDLTLFEEVGRLLEQHQADIAPGQLRNFYTHLRNCCTFLVHAGKQAYLPVLFEFQKVHYARGYMYINGKIPASYLINTVNIALRLGHTEWAEAFIKAHYKKIYEPSEQEEYYKLALSIWYFHTGRFEEALDELPGQFQEPDLFLLARRLELKLYYETQSDLLTYKIDAFKMYLSRTSKKQLNESMRERHHNFINLLLQLTNTVAGDRHRALRLVERINEKQVLSERDWLLEKAAALAVVRKK